MRELNQKIVRYLKRAGAGSMLISIIVHLIVLLLAALWVVSSVRPERKALFKGGDNAASAVQHPVRMSNTQPKLDTLTKRLSVDSPSSTVSLPDLPSTPDSGPSAPAISEKLGNIGGAGGPKGPVMPMFGFKDAQTGGALRGYLYDFKQNPQKQPNSALARLGPQQLAIKEVSDFIKSDWREESLRPFFRSPTPLYATQIFVPVMSANEAPKAYGVEKDVRPMAWMAHYKGRVSPPKTAVYRFVGCGDDLMAVRLDGKLVLDCGGSTVSNFKSDRPGAPSYGYTYHDDEWNRRMRGGFVVGHRMELRAGLFYNLDLVFSEGPGGKFCAMLLVQEEGAAYDKDSGGNPILPVFRVADTPAGPRAPSAPPIQADGPVWRALPAPR